MIIGANPWVSKGSFLHDPRMREHMQGVVDRGGRVFVVDPRRTETAERFEHVALRAGTDAWFLLSVLNVLFTEGLRRRGVPRRAHHRRRRAAAADARRFPPEATEAITGVPAETVRDVARTIGRAGAAVVYGRTGTCTQRFGTLNNVLHQAINVVTGNIQKPGGWVFGWSPIPTAEMSREDEAGHLRRDPHPGLGAARLVRVPAVVGALRRDHGAGRRADPGHRHDRLQQRSSPARPGHRLVEALEALDTFFAIDLYVNETNKYADYILPCTTMYEREDIPMQFFDRFVRPSLQVTEAVIEPPGECRPEWEILDDIARRMGLGGAYSNAVQRWLAKTLGLRIKPRQMADLLLRTGKAGDWFGLRRNGWSWKKLVERGAARRRPPRGPAAAARSRAGSSTPTRRSTWPTRRCSPRSTGWSDDAVRPRLPLPADRPAGGPLPQLVDAQLRRSSCPTPGGYLLRIHPADADALGLAEGDDARITSSAGEIDRSGDAHRRDDRGHRGAAPRLGPRRRAGSGPTPPAARRRTSWPRAGPRTSRHCRDRPSSTASPSGSNPSRPVPADAAPIAEAVTAN